MKKLILTILSVIIFTAHANPSLAVDPTDTPVGSPSAIQEQVKEKIKSVVQEKLKTTEESLETKAGTSALVGYQGDITDIAQNAVSLLSGKINLQISLEATNTAIIKDGKNIKAEQLSIKDKVIVIGNLTGNGVIFPKRIVVTKLSPKPARKTIFAPITKINLKSKSLAVTVNNQNQILVLDKKLELDLTTAKVGQKIFGVVVMPDDATDPATLTLAKII